jgi:hypothetical protein
MFGTKEAGFGQHRFVWGVTTRDILDTSRVVKEGRKH